MWGDEWAPRTRFAASCERAAAAFWRTDPVHEPHRAPDAGCECGVYAFKRREDAELLACEKTGGGSVLALGRVSLWGRVVETERGFRAEFAYPYDLEVLGGPERLVRQLRAEYAVDVSAGPAAVPLHAGSG